MGVYREWEFYGKNKDGSSFSSKQIECLVALDEYDLEDMCWHCHDTAIGSGHTESSFAYDRIYQAVEKYAGIYPDVSLTVIADENGEKFGFMIRNGKFQTFESSIIYTDNEGREIDPLSEFE